MRQRSVLMVLVAFLVALPAAAQETLGLRPGTRVRVVQRERGGEPIVGSLVRAGDTVQVAGPGGDTVAVPIQAVQSIAVSGGRRGHTWTGAAIGGAAVGGAALVVGVLLARGGSDIRPDAAGAVVLTAAGGALGGLVGGLVGSQIRTEQWTVVPLAGPAVVAGGRGAAGLRLGLLIRHR